MKIFIRVDGGEEIGLGHIMRMLALANELRKTEEVIFLCKDTNSHEYSNRDKKISCNISGKFKAGIDKIKENKFQVLRVDEKKLIDDIINLQNKYKADVLITDSYDVDEKYFNKLKPYFNLIGYVDDINKCIMNVDFIVNQNINAEDLDYSININKKTKLFLGPKYCMLRDEFKNSYNKKVLKEKCTDMLLTLGGMDKENNTIKILNEIIDCKINIHIVIGKAFSESLIKNIEDISEKYSNIKVHKNANMSELMKKCDIAISACGSTIYELCAMKVPSIGIIVADNQELVAKKMKDKSLILKAYYINKIEKNELYNALNKLIKNSQIRQQIAKKQMDLVNVDGIALLKTEIIKLYDRML